VSKADGQFMQRDGTGMVQPAADRITFAALRRSDDVEHTSPVGRPRIVDGLIGAGEDGFIHGSAICSVPNASASWHVGGHE
jgi:hypothetical protein